MGGCVLEARQAAGERLGRFSERVLGRPLRPYQQEVGGAILDSVERRLGLTFTVMMARQMGKNELSAHLEAWLLQEHAAQGGTIVKAAPTYRPQALTSMRRLEQSLDAAGLKGRWRRRDGHQITLDNAQVAFYSAEPQSNVMGATASLLLELDEAQDVDGEKFARDFRPMAASTNATTVLYGTAWTEDTLLAQQAQTNLRLERGDGVRRHFAFDWTHGAALNADYAAFVGAEIERLGTEHPVIKTQYRLECLRNGGDFFTAEHRLYLRGSHRREQAPQPLAGGARYVAGIDVAGAIEESPEVGSGSDAALRRLIRRKDSTVVGIARAIPLGDGGAAWTNLVEIYWWTGRPLHEQCDQLIHLLRDVWRCAKVVVDASGLGADLAARLGRALPPGVVEPYVFTVGSKSLLAYKLHAHAGSARLQMWREDGDAGDAGGTAEQAAGSDARSPEAAEFWKEVQHARQVHHSREQLGFYVPPEQGHDDFLTMLALVSWASRELRPEAARFAVRPPSLDDDRHRF